MANPNGRPKGAKNNPNRTRLPFKLTEIARAIRGVQAMGLSVVRIDVNPAAGTFSIVPGELKDGAKEAA